jgi:hypothetical protein
MIIASAAQTATSAPLFGIDFGQSRRLVEIILAASNPERALSTLSEPRRPAHLMHVNPRMLTSRHLYPR